MRAPEARPLRSYSSSPALPRPSLPPPATAPRRRDPHPCPCHPWPRRCPSGPRSSPPPAPPVPPEGARRVREHRQVLPRRPNPRLGERRSPPHPVGLGAAAPDPGLRHGAREQHFQLADAGGLGVDARDVRRGRASPGALPPRGGGPGLEARRAAPRAGAPAGRGARQPELLLLKRGGRRGAALRRPRGRVREPRRAGRAVAPRGPRGGAAPPPPGARGPGARGLDQHRVLQPRPPVAVLRGGRRRARPRLRRPGPRLLPRRRPPPARPTLRLVPGRLRRL